MSNELDRYRTFLADEDPLVIAVLKGHLVLESLLEEILGGLTDRGDLLTSAANTFHRKRLVAQAHAGVRSDDDAWVLLQKISTLRNEIAHNLESAKLDTMLGEISHTLEGRDPSAYQLIPDPHDRVQLISHSVAFLIGFLQGYRRDTTA